MEETTCPGEEFRHAELRSNTSIRLVHIHAELFRGEVSCTLEQYESGTGTCPDYVALSYVWGDSTPTHTIYINDLVYKVHQSLWEFLSHTRTKEGTERTLFWTDLLCIDQAHHSEKNEQISRMGDIYAQAACVTSWLGNHKMTEEALKTLVEISEDIDTGRAPTKYSWRSSESERIHRACDQLAFQKDYWKRVWILQEVACAKHCIVASGDTSVYFEDLLHKMEIAMTRSVRFDLSSDRERIMKHVKVLADLKTSIQQGKTIRILQLIEKTSFCQATRAQDKIYGLLGLASRLDTEFDSRAVEVSQQKSLDDVWWDIIFMISDKKSSASIKRDLATVEKLIRNLPPPSKCWELEMGSSIRRAQAETASWVSMAAYSYFARRLMDFSPREFTRAHEPLGHGYLLQREWDKVTRHVYVHEHDVPGLQTTLGWSTFAGLRFTSWYQLKRELPETLMDSRPLGWFCAAHSPDSPSKTTLKHSITPTYTIKASKEGLFPAYCSREEYGEAHCDMSLIVLKLEQLGITCLVRSADTIQISFYCDCCDPSLSTGWDSDDSLEELLEDEYLSPSPSPDASW